MNADTILRLLLIALEATGAAAATISQVRAILAKDLSVPENLRAMLDQTIADADAAIALAEKEGGQ